MSIATLNAKPRYQVEALEGEVDRVITVIENGKFVHKTVTEPAGYMVYLPSGASMRARSLEHLKELGIDPDHVALVDMDTGEEVPLPPSANLKQEVAARTRSRPASNK